MSATVVGDLEPNARIASMLEISLHTRPQWRAAHEVSQYVSRFLDKDLQRQCGSLRMAQAMAATIAYAVSELMENAAKYSVPGTVELKADMQEDEVIVTLCHAVAPAHASRYRDRAVYISQHDPAELLLATVEHNALSEGGGASGLGLLSLMSDYGARLGWLFEPQDSGADVRVTTQARLSIKH